MCGIVGAIGKTNVVSMVLDGLASLEYRGYDSVGVAIIDENCQLARNRVTSRVQSLKDLCSKNSFESNISIGHTRWATHGGVTVDNAHPHFSDNKIAIVHNGIIENYAELKEQLQSLGYNFDSETDTEVIAHLVHYHYLKSNDILKATKDSVKELAGTYAIGIICIDNPEEIICVREGSPLVIGVSSNQILFASDIFALTSITSDVIYLNDGDIAKVSPSDYVIYDKHGIKVNREIVKVSQSMSYSELGNYSHYMQKEIFEQPKAIAGTLKSLGDGFKSEVFGVDALAIFTQIQKIQIIACGTSYNAGLFAKYCIEEIAEIECNVDIASEYRYRKIASDKNTLIISISQSGETADTLASVKYAIGLGMVNTLAICNVPESSLARLSKLVLLTKAGPEIGVASTKAFTTQMVVLVYLAYTLAKVKGRLSNVEEVTITSELYKLPAIIESILNMIEPSVKFIANEIYSKTSALFLGRNLMFPIAVEGALKLKEISYIHAEGYAAGELKHGPLALLDEIMPVIVTMPQKILIDKVKSNIQEVLARKGLVYVITDCNDEITKLCHGIIYMPVSNISKYLLPIVYTVPLQLLAYHTAVLKGTDVDKPRNLAKSVTVE